MELLADLDRKFPHPPPELDLPAAIKSFSKGAELWRIYYQGGAHPTTWSLFRTHGPTDGRFDHHYDAYPKVQGIYYPSSMAANQPAVALYERAEASLPAMPTFHRPLTDPALLTPFKKAAASFGYGLV